MHSLWAVPVVLLIRWIGPFFLIRVGTFNSGRIGHFAADVGQQYAMLKEQPTNQVDLYWLPEETCNKFWAEMAKRNFPVSHWFKYIDLWNETIPGGAKHYRASTYTGSRDLGGMLEKYPAPMLFTEKEDRKARDWLRRQGWTDGERFVCLLVRDEEYLARDSMHRGGLDTGYTRWSYHSYRNTEISTYVPAMEWLANQGAWVFRMGKIMAKPIPSAHSKIIDYAFSTDKSDFLDVWLFAHCDLCITTGSGPDMVSDVYRRPLLLVNYLMLRNLWSWSNALHAPKHLVWKDSDRRLTWEEHLVHSYFSTAQYVDAGIEIHDLTQEEILHVTQECWMRLLRRWRDEASDIDAQQRFWEILRAYPDYSKFHGWVHPESRVSSAFLRVNPGWLQ